MTRRYSLSPSRARFALAAPLVGAAVVALLGHAAILPDAAAEAAIARAGLWPPAVAAADEGLSAAADEDDGAAGAAPQPAAEPAEPAEPADPAAAEASEPDAAHQPQRVVVRVNRYLTIKGTVALEDDDVIVVRDRRGELHSYPKSRVFQITRLVDPRPDQEAVVVLMDGQRREGVLLEDSFDRIVLEIKGIPTELPRESVDYMILEPPFEEQYTRFKSALVPEDHAGRVRLIDWLIQERRYDLAQEELEALLGEASVPRARRLLEFVEAQLELQAAAAKRPADADADNDVRDLRTVEGPTRLLTHEEINRIRVYEIDFDDPPRVTIEPAVIRALLEAYSTNPLVPVDRSARNALVRTDDPLRIVRLMFDLRAREFYPKVRVDSEPRSLNIFRQRVHNAWLMNNCATSRCHGGPDAGPLWLHRRGYRNERVRYTNLLILDRLKVDERWPLINYDEPIMSLIIQHALPRDEARLPHPDVPGWEPVFRRTNRKLLETSLEWIESMMKPRPDYGVEFEPPQPPAPEPEAPVGSGDRTAR